MSEDVSRRARAMGEEALRRRLSEIGMSKYDAKLYDTYLHEVSSQIAQLRVVLEVGARLPHLACRCGGLD